MVGVAGYCRLIDTFRPETADAAAVAFAEQLDSLGPFFAVSVHDGDGLPGAPWQPLATITADETGLVERVEGVRQALALSGGREPQQIEHRVAASVAQLGLVARLLSPVLALAATAEVGLEIDPSRTAWQPSLGGPYPLSLARDSIGATTPDAALVQLIDGPVRSIVLGVAALSVSPIVLWGNVASALNGAAGMLIRTSPQHAERVIDLTQTALAAGPLIGTATGEVGRSFRRESCCLMYRLVLEDNGGSGSGSGLGDADSAESSAPVEPGSAYCGDCIHLLPVEDL